MLPVRCHQRQQQCTAAAAALQRCSRGCRCRRAPRQAQAPQLRCQTGGCCPPGSTRRARLAQMAGSSSPTLHSPRLPSTPPPMCAHPVHIGSPSMTGSLRTAPCWNSGSQHFLLTMHACIPLLCSHIIYHFPPVARCSKQHSIAHATAK